MASGVSIVRPRDLATCAGATEVVNLDGGPVEGTEVDVGQASTEGCCENQDPAQADMNLRGRFPTHASGRFEFRMVKSAAIPCR